MLSRNNIFFALFLLALLIQIIAPSILRSLDELVVMLFLLVIALDLLINRNIKRYKALFVVESVFVFYFFFTIFFRHFNTPMAAANDFILQQKAFIPFLIAYSMTPRLTPWMRFTLKVVCIITSVALVGVFFSGMTMVIFGHVYHYGVISVGIFILYLYCSLNEKGTVSYEDLTIALLLLSVGLLSTRAKFFGEYVMALFMLFAYRPGMVRNLNFKYATALILGFALVIMVSWTKIKFYYITGNSNTFDPTIAASYARPILYATMLLIFMDYPVFGTGLASFATHSSSPNVNYSGVYKQYGIDSVWGLSPRKSDFISDAYFPELAQFGLVGVVLFITFWVWIYQKLRIALHFGRTLEFAIGVITICFAMIENTSGATILQSGGYIPMMVLGIIAGKYRYISKEEKKQILSNDYTQNQTTYGKNN